MFSGASTEEEVRALAFGCGMVPHGKRGGYNAEKARDNWVLTSCTRDEGGNPGDRDAQAGADRVRACLSQVFQWVMLHLHNPSCRAMYHKPPFVIPLALDIERREANGIRTVWAWPLPPGYCRDQHG